MSQFKGFKLAVEAQMASMESEQLYKVDVTKEEIWDMYLGSFPTYTTRCPLSSVSQGRVLVLH